MNMFQSLSLNERQSAMLRPAICYKEQIEDALKKYFYTDDMMFYIGSTDSYLIEISNNSENGKYQYAVIGNYGKPIGYIAYYLDRYSSCAYGFGAFSFDRGNPIMGKDLYELLEKLVNTLHRVEFRAIEGNPAIKGYDKFLEKHSDIGKKHILTDVFKDADGKYHDDYIYEFVNPEVR